MPGLTHTAVVGRNTQHGNELATSSAEGINPTPSPSPPPASMRAVIPWPGGKPGVSSVHALSLQAQQLVNIRDDGQTVMEYVNFPPIPKCLGASALALKQGGGSGLSSVGVARPHQQQR